MVNRLLIGALFAGFLFHPLSAPAGALRPLYWSCIDDACEPTVDPGRDGDGRVLLGYIKESAEPGTAPLHWTCISRLAYERCGRQALMAYPRYDGSLLLGYIPVEPRPGTVPLYWSCKQRDPFGECVELAPDNRGGSAGDSTLLGHVYADATGGQGASTPITH